MLSSIIIRFLPLGLFPPSLTSFKSPSCLRIYVLSTSFASVCKFWLTFSSPLLSSIPHHCSLFQSNLSRCTVEKIMSLLTHHDPPGRPHPSTMWSTLLVTWWRHSSRDFSSSPASAPGRKRVSNRTAIGLWDRPSSPSLRCSKSWVIQWIQTQN